MKKALKAPLSEEAYKVKVGIPFVIAVWLVSLEFFARFFRYDGLEPLAYTTTSTVVCTADRWTQVISCDFVPIRPATADEAARR
jgi:hypothetical protein